MKLFRDLNKGDKVWFLYRGTPATIYEYHVIKVDCDYDFRAKLWIDGFAMPIMVEKYSYSYHIKDYQYIYSDYGECIKAFREEAELQIKSLKSAINRYEHTIQVLTKTKEILESKLIHDDHETTNNNHTR